VTSALSTRAFRDCVGAFATGVTVVTAEADARRAGMTLNSFTSVSLEPMLILVSLAHGSRTLEVLRGARRFAVSVLHRGQRDVAIAFAERGAPFATIHTVRTPDGFLTVRGAMAEMRCDVDAIVPAGDHDLVLGLVRDFSTGGGEALVFHRGKFGGLEPDANVPRDTHIGLDEGFGW
jgi:flavin reductase (DIM6/NTAB) family NADH-FMN oxidoreductase RutF